jgi:hypothetical protein
MATLGYQLQLAVAALPTKPVRAAGMLASDALQRADVKRKRVDIGHPKNYTIVATAG